MGRRRRGAEGNTHEIFIVGEQLRTQMTDQGQVRDRRYHLRKYRKCFVAKDAIDWCVKLYHVTSRKEAVAAMRVLVKVGVIHHVTDEQEFSDAHIFFRFTRDDDTYQVNTELVAFYAGVELYRKLKKAGGSVLQEVYHKGNFYSETFTGSDILDFWCHGGQEREEATRECRELLERDIIKHVTDDYHFSDDQLLYEFALDFNKPCILVDVLHIGYVTSGAGSVAGSIAGSELSELSIPSSSVDFSGMDSGSPTRPPLFKPSWVPPTTTRGRRDSDKPVYRRPYDMAPKSAPSCILSLEEVRDPNNPHVKRTVRLQPDRQGMGVVLRGSAPCHVVSVEPLGPAAKAGIKPQQTVTHVNGHDVTSQDHREVGLLMTSQATITLTVVTSMRGSSHSTRANS